MPSSVPDGETDLVGQVEPGIAGLALPPSLHETVIRNIATWLEDPRHLAYRPQLHALITAKAWSFLADSFYRTIPFGTGGRRGPIGIGPNRMNHYTVGTSVQGHVNYLRSRFGALELTVVVAYDVRIFCDFRGRFDATAYNPLLTVTSRDFARLAASIYAANDVTVYTVPGDDGFLLSTPELSYAIRALSSAGGLNVSASHNHPDDNGVKFYTDYGGQPIPPHDEEMAGFIDGCTDFRFGSYHDGVARGRIRFWTPEHHDAYISSITGMLHESPNPRACVVYSPLNGTGRSTVAHVLERAGCVTHLVSTQSAYDGTFPHVKYRIPNPEVPESMDAAVADGRRLRADVAFATDPDADRLGVCVPGGDGRWHFLSGNVIAAILAAYVVGERSAGQGLPPGAFMLKSAVTTNLITAIAARHDVGIVGDLLVGFKYIAAALEDLEHRRGFRGLSAPPASLLLAAEESHGVLSIPTIRDKDAATGAILLAELAAHLKSTSRSFLDYLDDIYVTYGYWTNASYSLVMEGITGGQRTQKLMDVLRATPPAEIRGARLRGVTDYHDTNAFGPFVSNTDRDSRNQIILQYSEQLQITIRPSGTEPKLKFYFEKSAGTPANREALPQIKSSEKAFVRAAIFEFVDGLLRAIGISLARPGFGISSLVSLENKLDFVERFLPELDDRLAPGHTPMSAQALEAWVETRLKGYGQDPRFLVRAGIRDHLHATAHPSRAAEAIEAVKEVFFLDEDRIPVIE
jgi:phosphoglucomutase